MSVDPQRHPWEYAAPNIPQAFQNVLARRLAPLTADDLAMMRVRFMEGSEEHDHDWLRWPNTRFIDEGRQEFLDDVLYEAMRMVPPSIRRQLADAGWCPPKD